MIREAIYNIIEKDDGSNRISHFYDTFMLIVILLSIVPLMFIEYKKCFFIIEDTTTAVFIADYLLRWYCSDLNLKKGKISFIVYPFTGWAIIDLVSILPSFNILNAGFKIIRLMRLAKILRLLKVFRYSSKILLFVKVLKKEKDILMGVLFLALVYIFITALIMFNVEPHNNPVTGEPTFNSFFDAIYWATVTLTTVGYGDLCPVTEFGRLISIMSSLFGVAIIALPSGVITASYLDELREMRKEHGRNTTSTFSGEIGN